MGFILCSCKPENPSNNTHTAQHTHAHTHTHCLVPSRGIGPAAVGTSSPACKPLCLPVCGVVRCVAHPCVFPPERYIVVSSENPRLWALGSSCCCRQHASLSVPLGAGGPGFPWWACDLYRLKSPSSMTFLCPSVWTRQFLSPVSSMSIKLFSVISQPLKWIFFSD